MKDQFDPNEIRTEEEMYDNLFNYNEKNRNYQPLPKQDGVNLYETLNSEFTKTAKQSYKTLLQNEKVELPFSRQLTGWNNLIEGLYRDSKKLDDSQLWVDFPEDDFVPNRQGFRADEFKKDHEGKHILFNGCSVTYGQGLYTNETWSYLLYKMISENEKVSGYYNIGTPGKSIFDIVASTFKYIDKYGNPDEIFLDLPDLNRFYALNSDSTAEFDKPMGPGDTFYALNDNYRHSIVKQDTTLSVFVHTLYIYMYQYLMFLEIYCKSNNIKLYLFSYVRGTDAFFRLCNLDNYIVTTDIEQMQEIEEGVFNYTESHKDDKYTMIARDGRHYGTAFHYVWAKMLYNIYKGKTNVNWARSSSAFRSGK